WNPGEDRNGRETMRTANGRNLLSGCVCCEAPSSFAGTAVSRRSFLAGSAAATSATVLGAAASPFAAMPVQAQATRRIDLHHHIIPPVQAEALRQHRGGNPAKWSVQASLDDMEKGGVTTSITSIQNPGVWFGQVDEASRKLARECNEYA